MKLDVSSADVEALCFAIGVLQVHRERLLARPIRDGGEYAAQIAVAEATIGAVVKRALLDHPVIHALTEGS